jgi:hypothetical protein
MLAPPPEPDASGLAGARGVLRFAATNETYVRESALLAAFGGV